MSAAEETAGMQPVTLTLNGMQVEAQPGQTILDVARAAGVDIPTLCHDPRLEPYGACRMCLVEVEGARGPMAACGTAVREGMVVQTHSEKILKLRKFVLELLLTNHPLDCPVCEAAGDCRLQDYAYEYLVDMVPWGWRPPVVGEPGDHPNIAHFGARCILCGRCVRICREVMSIGCWGYLNRGYDSEVDTPYRLPLAEVGCVSCGQCVSTCPVGAITGQRSPQGAREWQTEKTVTTCSYCADGCRLVLHSYRGRISRVSAELEKGLNGGNLCVKGRFGLGYTDSADRLTEPLVRGADGGLSAASWEEALAVVARRLRAVIDEHGGAAAAAMVGTHCTNEAAYLAQKLMRTLVGSNTIEAEDWSEWSAYEAAADSAVGALSAQSTRADLAKAEVILLVGADLTESDPVLALDVIKAIRKGRKVIVIDALNTSLAEKAFLHLAVKPGTEAAVLRAMMGAIVDAGMEDKAFMSGSTDAVEPFMASLQAVDVATETALAGADLEAVRSAATAFAGAGAAFIVLGPAAAQGAGGADAVGAAADLALLTGNHGRPGAGVYAVRSGANSRGLADMGVRSHLLPTGEIATSSAVSVAEAAWGAALAAIPAGVAAADLVPAIESGQIRALYVIGADPALSLAGHERVKAALESLDLLVVQDAFLTDTAALADVVLPAAVAAEDDGTFTNGEGMVQRVRPAVPAQGKSLQDWVIVQKIADALGGDWAYQAPEDVMREIAELVLGYRGVSYPALDAAGGVHVQSSGERRATFVPVTPGSKPPEEQYPSPDDEFPLTLVTGPLHGHHGTGERSRRAPGLAKLQAEPPLELNPADAGLLGIAAGEKVRVSARGAGSVEVEAAVTARVPAGTVFLGRFSAVAPVSRLIGPGASSAAVRVEKL